MAHASSVLEYALPFFSPAVDGDFLPTNKHWQADLLVLKQLVEKSLPKLSEHLQTIGLELEFVAIAWFLRLFVGLLPTEVPIVRQYG